MTQLTFSNCNIQMATNVTTGRYVVWDTDADVFGSGHDFPAALSDLAENYPEDYNSPRDEE